MPGSAGHRQGGRPPTCTGTLRPCLHPLRKAPTPGIKTPALKCAGFLPVPRQLAGNTSCPHLRSSLAAGPELSPPSGVRTASTYLMSLPFHEYRTPRKATKGRLACRSPGAEAWGRRLQRGLGVANRRPGAPEPPPCSQQTSPSSRVLRGCSWLYVALLGRESKRPEQSGTRHLRADPCHDPGRGPRGPAARLRPACLTYPRVSLPVLGRSICELLLQIHEDARCLRREAGPGQSVHVR